MIDDKVDPGVEVLVDPGTEGSEGSQGRLKTPSHNPKPALVPGTHRSRPPPSPPPPPVPVTGPRATPGGRGSRGHCSVTVFGSMDARL